MTAQGESEPLAAPMCGACLVIAKLIRDDLLIGLGVHESIWPPDTQRSVAALRGTLWDTELNLDALAAVLKTEHVGVDDLKLRSDPAMLQSRVEDRRARILAAVEEQPR